EAFGQGNEDVDLFLRLALLAPVHFLPETLVNYRIHSGQASQRAMQQQRQQLRLYKKWLSADGPAGERLGSLIQTWKLYEGRLVPGFWLNRAACNLRQRDLKEGARCLLRSVKHVLLYHSLPFRKLLWWRA
ncbi:MAG TPA: hypothetical protein VFW40_07600, partial [Capsulimonadaceae bacterium]|nr:hypothetical protein [Capsulimonadaceae bacterium]